MFAIDCHHHGARTLVPIDAIRRLEPTDHGFELEVECWCGALVTVSMGQSRLTAEAA